MGGSIEIRYGWNRPQPLPFDFLFTKVFLEKVTVADKKEGTFYASGGIYGATTSMYAGSAYFIFVITEHGDLRLTVSKKLYDYIQKCDSIIVSYQRGRWTKDALKGKIAR